MPLTFSKIYSKDESFSRFTDEKNIKRKKFKIILKKFKILVKIVKSFRKFIFFLKSIKKIILKLILNIFLPKNDIELFYKEIGLENLASKLKTKRIKRIVKDFSKSK